MNILLLILKIIGILLLVILILIGLLLFHPIFYQIEGKVEEEYSIKGHFWWLFQILRFEFVVENGDTQIRFRIFGFSKKKKASSAESDEGTSLSELSETETSEASLAEESKTKDVTEETTSANHSEIKTDQTESVQTEPTSHHNKKDSKANKKAKSLAGKKHFTDSKAVFDRIKQEFFDEKNKQAVSHFWKEFMYLLKHLKPKYVKGNVSFSTGDPALTGQVTGILSLMPVVYKYAFRVCPDFMTEDFYIKGIFSMKGHIALCHIAIICLRMIRDNNFIRLIHKIKNRRYSSE